MTQTELVIRALRENGEAGLTPIEALDRIGCFRLAARISDAKLLLRPGETIVTEMVRGPNGKSWARYVLRAPAAQLEMRLA